METSKHKQSRAALGTFRDSLLKCHGGDEVGL